MKLDYISARGDRLPLATNNLFALWHVDGMTAAGTSIASNAGSADGEEVNNVRANARPIVIDLRVREGVEVEEAKRAILRVVKLKQTGTLEWTHKNGQIFTLSGVVEAVDMPRWSEAVTMQITMFCGQPYWEDAAFVVQQISEALDLHYFEDSAAGMLYFPTEGIALGEYDTIRTKSFHNGGDVTVGLEISIVAFDTVTNPIIYDRNGNFLGVGYGDGARRVQMQTGDVIVITTHRGKKAITLNGQSILHKLRPQSTWLQLEAGDNTFTINSDDDSLTNMTFALVYKQRYV